MSMPSERRVFDDWFGLILIASVIFAFGYSIYRENQEFRLESANQQYEAYKPNLYTVVTREATYKDLRRAGSGEYETPEGKRIDFNEPYTELEQ